jgi:putative hemolysin
MELALLPILIALVPLVVVSAFCSAAETTLFSLTHHDRLRLAKSSPGVSASVAFLLARPRALLVSLLLVNTLANTLYFVLTSLAALELSSIWAQVALTFVNLVVLTVLGEVVSKMLASRYRLESARLLAAPTLVLFGVLGPLRTFLEFGIMAPLSRLFAPERAVEALTGEELSALLRVGAGEGHIDADEQTVLRQVIRFGSLRVKDVMIPRTEMVWLDQTAGLDDVRKLYERTRLTRVPVCRGSLDEDVLGQLNVKSYVLAAARTRSEPRLADHVEPARYVPQSAGLDRLLESLRSASAKVGVVVDEHGSVVGVVSTQDVVRRLIVELETEPTAATGAEVDPSEGVELVGPGRWVVPGRLSVREWAEMFGLRPDRRVSTVSGLVFARLGRLPVAGDRVTISNVELEVMSVAGRVADRVGVRIAPPSVAAQGSGARR